MYTGHYVQASKTLMCIKIFKTNLGRRVQREGELKCWRMESTQILALTLGFLLSTCRRSSKPPFLFCMCVYMFVCTCVHFIMEAEA